MKEYEKTINLYPRHKEGPGLGKYDVARFAHPAFNRVNPYSWSFTEKLDGMNIRLILGRTETGELLPRIYGRSDAAQIATDLVDSIYQQLDLDEANELIGADPGTGITIYGEGIGPGIQKGGGALSETKDFRGFDVAMWTRTIDGVVSQYYLSPLEAHAMIEKLGLKTAPVLHLENLDDAVRTTKAGFPSALGQHPLAEGIIGVAPDLFFYEGGSMRRLKFKLKTKDFVPGQLNG